MVIQHNLSAMNSHRQMGVNNAQTSKNLEKLSSGYRINRAGDDAAGLAISEKMRGQIRGLDMASTNASNGVSLIQTAEGGLNETHSILQRMRELAVQSANGTYHDDVDRENIAKEVEALKSEIDRIASATNYNGIKLLDGSLGGQSTKALLASEGGCVTTASLALNTLCSNLGLGSSANTLTLATGDYMDKYAGAEATLIVRYSETGSSIGTADATISLQIGDQTYGLKEGSSTVFEDASGNTVATLSANFTAASVTATGAQSSGVVKVTLAAATMTVSTMGGTATANQGVGLLNAETTVISNNKSELVFQIGANGTADQRVGLHVDNMSTSFIGDVANGKFIADIDVSTRELANDAISVIDKAINQVSGTRADLGALQNRLEHTINNLGTTSENLQAAESSIRDVDMAKEMMQFTKNNILVQASQSMLAQANQLPQGVLQLLQ